MPRTRSSHKFAERSDANFEFRSGTTRIDSRPNAASIAIRFAYYRKCLLRLVSQVGAEQQHQIEAVIHCSSFCFGWAPIWRDAN